MNERDVMIQEHMEYARERARWHARKHPSLREDIMSVSMLALIQAVEMQPGSIRGCISKLIDHAVAELVSDNDIIRVPRTSKARMLKEEKLWPKAQLVEDTELWDLKKSRQHPAWVMLHIEDVFRLLKLSPYERKIVALRMRDYTLDEIAQEVERTPPTIHHILSRISERYRRLTLRYPELLKPNDDEA